MPVLTDSEAIVHQQVVQWLKLQHPNVLFRTDMGGIRLTRGQAVQAARLQAGRAWPDIFLAEPRSSYHGAFFELKRAGTMVWLKRGGLNGDPHIREQAAMLDSLRGRGYHAEFAIGFDHFKFLAGRYLRS